ncbi:protein cordon-bleu isoform X2 [Silurus meridionalis]|uniref:protein cordon-bleu isoform X2 n=1 Tax=Silurus meridionalis TaxID=175797 RepID=UPI001EEC9D5E|nr:protein cordon-bleu isoform X2 [Silurus meridionalis]
MEQVDLIERNLTLTVLLPEGHERTVTVHGSKPVMDVLVILCARYHLNPSDHVLELFSTNHNKLKFKPSSLIGSLEAELIMLKPKRSDSKKVPHVPVATVRLMINYRKSHKAVVRVSPQVPLAELMPAVCEKCEMDPKSTLLLRDSQSEEPLDLTKTLNDYAIRDLYAKAISNSPPDPATLTHKDCKKDKSASQEKVQGEKENRGLLGLFRRSRKSLEETAPNTTAVNVASSLVLKDQHGNETCCPEVNSASSMTSCEMTKKRRAPQPPSMLGSRSVSCELNSGQQVALPSTDDDKQGVLSRVSSAESSLKRHKRRAPPPPCTSSSLPDPSDDKESSYTGGFLEDEEENATFKKPTCSSIPVSTLMNEVLSEFTDRMKTMERRHVSFDGSITHPPPALSHSLVSGSLDGDPVVPPGCKLLRHGSQRDGLTTFTVVPQRRPQNTRQYEFLITMETSETTNEDPGGNLEGSGSESGEVEQMETFEKDDAEFENEVETGEVLSIKEGFGKLNLDVNSEKHHSEHKDGTADQDGREWMDEFRTRRRRFLTDDHWEGGDLKTSRKVLDQEMEDDYDDCWEVEDTENLEETESFRKEETEEHEAGNVFPIYNPNLCDSDPQRDPTSDVSYNKDPYWDVQRSSNLHISNSDTPNTSFFQTNPHNHQPNSVQSLSKSKPDPSTEHSPPNSTSLFALAVSKRVQSRGNASSPLNPSARRTPSPTPCSPSASSQHTSSKKLYFQNLITEEFTVKTPASLGPWNEAPPISTAPPPVALTPQAKRQTWSSFSRAQMKNLEQI